MSKVDISPSTSALLERASLIGWNLYDLHCSTCCNVHLICSVFTLVIPSITCCYTAAKYVGKSEGQGWTYQQVKSIISESVQMSESVDPRELQRLAEEESEMYPLGPAVALAYQAVLNNCQIHCLNEGTKVKRLGGLHVIGTSLHESRRIDNQVRNNMIQSTGFLSSSMQGVFLAEFSLGILNDRGFIFYFFSSLSPLCY